MKQVQVRKSTSLKTFDTWGPNFSVSFKFKIVKDLPMKRWHNMLVLTTGKSQQKFGRRLPAIWLYRYRNGKYLVIISASAIRTKRNRVKSFRFYALPNRTNSLKVEYKALTADKKKSQFVITFNDQIKFRQTVYNYGRVWRNVMAYASDPYYASTGDMVEVTDLKLATAN